MIHVNEAPEKKYTLFFWCCTCLALVFTLSFIVTYLDDVQSALANARQLAGYLVLFIPLSISLWKDSEEIGQQVLLFYGLLLMFWAYGLLLSIASWLSLGLGILFMCGWIRYYDEDWSCILFMTFLLCSLLLGETLPQFGLRFIENKDLVWAGLFDEFLHLLAALLVILPLILSEEKMAKRGYMLFLMILAAILIDLDHINPLLFFSTGRGVVRARTVAHSFLFGGLASLPFWFHRDKNFGLTFVLAHFSHILRDSYGSGRVPMLWPLSIQRYPKIVYPLGMVILFLISLGFHYRTYNHEEGYRRVTPRQIFWAVSFALLIGVGIFFLKRIPPLQMQVLPSVRWAQRGGFLLLIGEVLFLSLWFPDKENPKFSSPYPSPYLFSGVCSGLVAGVAYILSAGMVTLPYFLFLIALVVLLVMIARCQQQGVHLSP
ncbi:MAG: metal-dependent hydrolase [bacterium]|nr:metal-dependent hydrolase [bacterium]